MKHLQCIAINNQYEEMKYPKMPKKLDRRYKILPKDRKGVRKMYKEEKSIYAVAKYFDVCPQTIWLIINPKGRERALERTRERNHFLWATDEKYRKKVRIWSSERRKYARKVNPLIKEYYKTINRNHPELWSRGNKKRWQKIKSNPSLLKKINKKHKDWVDKNKEHVNKMARKNYRERKRNLQIL